MFALRALGEAGYKTREEKGKTTHEAIVYYWYG
jgi:hypothetical protein